VAGRIEAELEGAVAGEGVEALGEGVGGGLAGEEADFEGAEGFVAVVGVDAGGGGGVEAGEEAVEAGALGEAGAEGGGGGGAWGEAAEEGAEVETGAAAEDGEAAAGGDGGQEGLDGAGEVAGGEGLVGGAEVEEVVRGGLAVGGGEFGGADVEAGEDLKGVGVEDFAVEAAGEGDGEIALAGAGGAGDREEGGEGGHDSSVGSKPFAAPGNPFEQVYTERQKAGRMRLLQRYFMTLAGLSVAVSAYGQAGPGAGPRRTENRGGSYYNYAMGHLYADLAQTYGNRAEYLNKAIEFFKAAMKDDPSASFVAEEMSDLYIQAGRLREAVSESEAAIKANPNDLTARRILGRIFSRLVGDPQTRGLNEEMLKRATEQYRKITELDASDAESWMMLGRLHKIAQNSVDAKIAYEKALALDAENVDALSGLALVLADVGDTAKAAELLKKVAEKSPNLRTLTALAQAYEQMRDYGMASETLRKALEMQPENLDIKKDFANSLVMADKVDEALRTYEELVKEDPKDALSQLRLSQIYRQKVQFDKAWEASNAAKRIDANNLEIRYNEANLYEGQGKYAEAITALKDVLAQSLRGSSAAEKNNRAMLLERLGLLYRNNDQPAEAVAQFSEMGSLDKDLGARGAAQVVDTWRQARQYPKAIAAADEALQRYPDDRMIRIVRASALAESGRTAEAVEDLKKMLGGKGDRETHLQMAQLYDKAKNYGEMSKSLDAAEGLSKTDEEREAVWFSRGAMFEKQKRFDEAEREFRKVLAVSPNNPGALNYLGYMLADRNVRVAEAEKMIAKALEQEPNNGAYLDSLGWAQYRLGKYDEALTSLQRSAALTQRDSTIHDHLGDVYFKLNKLKEAIAAWQQSIKEWEASAPSERENVDITKVQKKLEAAKAKVAREK
jgi:tetratricopeptide (TPR) repeat protein